MDASTGSLIIAPNSGSTVLVVDMANCRIAAAIPLVRDQPERYDPGGLTFAKFVEPVDGIGPILLYERGVVCFRDSELAWHAVHGQFTAAYRGIEFAALQFDTEDEAFSVDLADGSIHVRMS